MTCSDDSREKVIKLFDDYSIISSEAKYNTIYGERIRIFTTKQMLNRTPTALAQVKQRNTSENTKWSVTSHIFLVSSKWNY